jgi:Cof subfamily protein (haloacid dehalogenase superfamily)
MSKVRLVLSDVDGTLVTPDKVLTKQSILAVERLGKAGILFAITSGRPPRGISMFIEPLNLTTPLAAFNGGMLVDRNMKTIEQRTIKDEIVEPTIELLTSHGMSIWVYQDVNWFVLDAQGPHIQHNAMACQFEPTEVTTFDGIGKGIAKVVGVSDDLSIVAAARSAMREKFADEVSATSSQSYYLDITHPDANKGKVVDFLSAKFNIAPEEIATIGDMENDILMFARSGLSIAMGKSNSEVRSAAKELSLGNDEEGFAFAMNNFILN